VQNANNLKDKFQEKVQSYPVENEMVCDPFYAFIKKCMDVQMNLKCPPESFNSEQDACNQSKIFHQKCNLTNLIDFI
jgi:hypothetical protein